MDIEREFAAAVFNSCAVAEAATDAGYPYRACDEVAAALAELWRDGRDAGLSDEAIQAIADRHVEWDSLTGEAWPRDLTPTLH